ncbi:MAG: glycosyltransferase, partial [Nanoarchaeota archaeon]
MIKSLGAMDMKHKISIITPVLNGEKYIATAIESVLNQEYPYVEHIIIDGLSTDNTVNILKTYDHIVWVSEKDN